MKNIIIVDSNGFVLDIVTVEDKEVAQAKAAEEAAA